MWMVPMVYMLVAGVEAVLAGSVVGLMCVRRAMFFGNSGYGALICSCRLGAVYDAGSFKMSTIVPFLWALINVLVLIISSFAIQGGL